MALVIESCGRRWATTCSPAKTRAGIDSVDFWRRSSPGAASLGDYVHIMIEEAERLVERWQAAASEGRSVDLYPEMVGITSRMIGRILFGADVSRALPELTRFSIVNEELLRRAVSPHPMPRWLPTSHNRRLTHELAQVRRIVDEIIAERQSDTG